MLSRSRTRDCAKILLAALLFAQAAVAAARCDMPDLSPAQVFTQPESMPCHEEPARNANLCLAQCLSADQSADTPQFVVPAKSGIAPLVVMVADGPNGQAAKLRHEPPRPAGPPPRILFSRLLI